MIYEDVAANTVRFRSTATRGVLMKAQTYWYSVDMRNAPESITGAFYMPTRKRRWICPTCGVHTIFAIVTGKILMRTKSRYGLYMRKGTIRWRKGKEEERQRTE